MHGPGQVHRGAAPFVFEMAAAKRKKGRLWYPHNASSLAACFCLPMNLLRHALPSHAVAGDTHRRVLDDDICVHIFTSSSVMVGVCLTVVGILRVVVTLRSEDVLGDDLLTINTMVYLLSALISYWALRTRSRKRNHRLEYLADGLFLLGMVFTVVNTAFITWAMTRA
jgi:heme/copper-type cytochrome/quinol oxidase subunit 3